MVSGHAQAVTPTGPGQLRMGLGKPIRNIGRLKSGSKGEDRRAESAMRAKTIGKKTKLSVIRIVVDFRRCFFSVHEVRRTVSANCNFEINRNSLLRMMPT